MKTVKKAVKKDWYILLIILAGFIFGLLFYPRLPAQVAIHWNAAGKPDGYGTKLGSVFFIPVMNLVIYLLFLFLPFIDPKKANYSKFQGSYQMLKCLMAAFITATQVGVISFAIGIRFNMSILCGIGASILFIIIGNTMGRFRFNYFVGIRTPWTLANEDVWRKTHRMAGPVWILGGVINLIATFLAGSLATAWLIIIVMFLCIAPLVYSYFAYHKLEK